MTKLAHALAKASVLVGATVVLGAGPASAAYVTFFGEDANNSATVPLASTPTSTAKSAQFQSSLIGVGTEDFEGIATGTGAPLGLTFPGAGTATLSGGSGVVASVTAGTTNGAGRYSVPSPSSSNFWEVSAGGTGNFVVTFSTAVAAFGFWGIDIGDFGGQLELELRNGATVLDTLTVPNTIGSNGSTDGSVLFFGLIGQNAGDVFDSIAFNTTTGQGDIFAFDLMTVGSLEQVRQTPEPASLALLGVALAGLGALRRRKSS